MIIDIPKRSKACSKNQEAFLPEMEYVSTLVPGDEKSGFLRQDYCMNCWQDMQNRGATAKGASVWKSKVPKKNSSDLPKQQNERALYLLKGALALEEITTNAMLQNEAFILSLFLSRKRKIVLRQEVEKNDLTYLVYEVRETEELLLVPKLELSKLQIETTQQSLSSKLNGK